VTALLVLSVAFIVQSLLFAWTVRAAAEERRRFLAAVMSKDPGEFVAVERATAPRRAKRTKKTHDEPVPPQPYGL
jgi:hypothetical protein